MFLVLHYFFIEIQGISKWYFLFIIIFFIFLEISIFSEKFSLTFSIIFFNLSIFVLYNDILDYLTNRVYINTFFVFIWGINLFALFISLSISLLIFYKYDKLMLECNTLYNGLDRLVDIVSKPLKLPFNEILALKQSIDKIATLKVKDVLWINFSSYTWLSINRIYNTWTNINKFVLNTWTWYMSKWLIWKIEQFKYKLIDKVLEDKRSVDKWVCQYVIDKIKDNYNKSWFKLSIFILLSLLLWPFFKIWLWILSILNWILFRILVLFKIYSIKKISRETDFIY